MAVNTPLNKVIANGNDVATVFSFNPVVIQSNDELLVRTVDDVGNESANLIEGTDYTITADSGFPYSGSVNYPITGSPLPTGWRLLMVRKTSRLQETVLENQGGYNPKVQEYTFDQSRMIDQDQDEEIGRGVKMVASTDPGFVAEIKPIPDTVIGIDITGTKFENYLQEDFRGEPGPEGPEGPAGDGDMNSDQSLGEIALDGVDVGGSARISRVNIATMYKSGIAIGEAGANPVASDRGKVLNYEVSTSAQTVQLATAATYGSGWACEIVRNGTDTGWALTIQPATGEKLNTITNGTYSLYGTEESVVLYTDGQQWWTFGEGQRVPVTSPVGPSCRLVLDSATVMSLRPVSTDWIPVNGHMVQIPTTFPTYNAPGANTARHMYAVFSGGTLQLQGHGNAPVIDPEWGYAVDSTNRARTHVGYIHTDLSVNEFKDSATARYVWSRYHRIPARLANQQSAVNLTTSTSFVNVLSTDVSYVYGPQTSVQVRGFSPIWCGTGASNWGRLRFARNGSYSSGPYAHAQSFDDGDQQQFVTSYNAQFGSWGRDTLQMQVQTKIVGTMNESTRGGVTQSGPATEGLWCP